MDGIPEELKGARSAEEVLSRAKAMGLALSEEEAKEFFGRISGALADDDLESVAGGIGHAFGEWYAGKRLL